MTRRKIHWVPRSSGDLVNLGLDVDDDMVSGLSYKTFTLEDSPWSQQVREPEAPEMGKYDAAWRTMIPFRLKPKFPAPKPLDDAGLFSYLTLSWFSPVMIQGLRKRLDEDTIPQLSVHDTSAKNTKSLRSSTFREHLESLGVVLDVLIVGSGDRFPDSGTGHRGAGARKSKGRCQHGFISFGKKKSQGMELTKLQCFGVMLRFQDCCFSAASVLGPMLVIPKILEYTEERLGNIAYGVGLCFALFITKCMKSLGMCSCWVINQHTGNRFCTAVFSFAFEKLIRLKSLTHITMGETLWPTRYLPNIYCLVRCIKADIPKSGNVMAGQASHLLGISFMFRGLLYALGRLFLRKEMELLEKRGFILSLTTTTLFTASSMASVVTFLIHTGLRLKLTASVAFTTVATLNPMRLSVVLLPFTAKGLAMSRSASERFKKFFLQESPVIYVKASKDPRKTATLSWRKTCPGIVNGALELEKNGHTPEGMTRAQPPLGALRPEDKGDTQAPELHKINLVVDHARCLWQHREWQEQPVVSHPGGDALAGGFGEGARKPGLCPPAGLDHRGSIRESILIGSQYDKARYLQVLHCCSLNHDLEILPFGDMTEIRERGLNLTGGQKQRISLARAVYSDCELYLLDHPLSAVDTHMGKHIFEECIEKALRGKTVILVTHQLQYLEFCDQIILLEDGKICEKGIHSELIQKKGRYAQLTQKMHREAIQGVLQGIAKAAEELQVEGRAQTTCPEERLNENAVRLGWGTGWHPEQKALQGLLLTREGDTGDWEAYCFLLLFADPVLENQLTQKEKMEKESLKWNIHHHYIQAAGGTGCYLVSAMVFLLLVMTAFFTMFNLWRLSYWLEQGSGTNSSQESNRTTADPGDILDNPQLPFYQLVYGLSALFAVCMGICTSAAFTKVVRKAPTALHNKLFNKTANELYLVSRIQVFAMRAAVRDLHELDQFLPTVAEQSLLLILVVTTILMIVSVVSLSVLLMGVVTLIVCLVYFRMFKRAINVFKSLENYSSPLFSHILTTLHSLSSINVYGETEDSISNFKRLTDAQHNYPLMFLSSTRWVALKLELMTSVVSLMVALFTFFGVSSAPYSTNPRLSAFSCRWQVVASGLWSDSGVHGTLITPWVLAVSLFWFLVTFELRSLYLKLASNFQACIRISSETEAYFTAVERMLQYMKMCASETPLHIEDTNCPHGWLQHGEITFQDYQMKYRDNTPIVLYSFNLTIHGQEVVGIVGRMGSGKSSLGVALFCLVEPAAGRILIDGVDICSLGLEHLLSKFSIIPQDPVLLSGTIRFNLDPFDHRTDEQIWDALERTSLSEMWQLLCITRALLRSSKATASTDLETDTLIQRTTREGIRGCTVLIITHRITTILNCDRILVMSNRKVVEFDRPEVLRKKPGSMPAALLATASSLLSSGEGRPQ
ncbi:hypothetical protein EI555_016179 [Monodon monoceros]|uniref:ABC transporter domain-containing protein n=1 Tax=Monodon monoceros TaxID=40151 RepID=A0A4U1EQ09_MONMO|nr:hypothetical protein EI555_016179 [Monodon monoceros]